MFSRLENGHCRVLPHASPCWTTQRCFRLDQTAQAAVEVGCYMEFVFSLYVFSQTVLVSDDFLYFFFSVSADCSESTPASDIFDLALTKVSFSLLFRFLVTFRFCLFICLRIYLFTQDWYDGLDQFSASLVSSSPPYFCGSPPARAANPIVHDARFVQDKYSNNDHSPLTPTSPMSPTTSNTARKGGCSRPITAKVRVEGFDCLNRDIGGHGIPAVA